MKESLPLRVKRVYDPPSAEDGVRLLVDRLWPRGLKKEAAKLDDWLKEIAPSDSLRQWFGHDPSRWEEFRKRYSTELDGKPEMCRAILKRTREETVTLLYGAKDEQHNNAVALLQYLQALRKR